MRGSGVGAVDVGYVDVDHGDGCELNGRRLEKYFVPDVPGEVLEAGELVGELAGEMAAWSTMKVPAAIKTSPMLKVPRHQGTISRSDKISSLICSTGR